MTKERMETIQQNLISEYHRLLDPSLEYLNGNFENYPRVCFAGISIKKKPSAKKPGGLLGFLQSDQDFIADLGILGNPFFYEPCYPMTGYSAVESNRKKEEGIIYSSSTVTLETGKVKVIQPKAYGDSLKIHACFYMDILASTSCIYLNYLKGVLANSL